MKIYCRRALKLVTSMTGMLLMLAPMAYTQVKPKITRTIDPTQRKMLAGTVHPLTRTASDQGRVDAGLTMKDMLLTLRPSADQQATLKKYVDDLHNPNSPNFHKWLTPAQYAAQFGGSDEDVQAISSWLSANGFSIEEVSRSKSWIRFSGNAGQVETAFQTEIHQYSVKGVKKYANATNLSIPVALEPAVTGVVSMNNFLANPQHTSPATIARNENGKLARVASTSTPATASPSFTSAGSQIETYLLPGDFSKIYDTQPVINNGINGTGVSIAVVGRSDISMSDIEAFRTIAGLPFNDPNVIYATTDPGVVEGDNVEASLDLEWAGAVAPKARIDYVIGATTSTTDGVDIAASYIVDKALAPIMTVSFGLCEADMSDSQISFYHLLWQQAAAEGITVFVSSGDAGASGCNDPGAESTHFGFGVNGLASTAYNVAVGGTEFNDADLNTYWNLNNAKNLSSAIGYIPEAVWNESCAADVAPSFTNCNFPPYYLYSYAGGGGASSCATRTTDDSGTEYCATGYTKPSWQTGVGVPQDGVRDLPDLSLAAAAEHDGYMLCYEGSCQWTKNSDGSITLEQASIVGGTSAAAPSMAGIMALVEQKHGQFQGVANYQFYQLANAQQNGNCNSSQLTDPTQKSACVFHDITLGSNAVPCFKGGQDCQGTDSPVVVGLSLPPALFPPNSFTDGHAATAGYDLASGLGSVDAANLINSWDVHRTLRSATTLSLSQTTFKHGTSVVLSGKVSASSGKGMPSGDVLITANSAESVASAALSAGMYNASTINLPGGHYTLTAEYSGDATYGTSNSNPVAVTVAPEDSTVTGTSYAYSRFYILGNRPIVQLNNTSFGNPYWLRFQVAGLSRPTDATGSIQLSQGGKSVGTYPVDKTGMIYIQCGPQTPCDYTPGTYTFNAAYSGDGSFHASSATLTFTIAKGTTYWETAASNTTPIAGTRITGYVYFGSDPAAPPSGAVTLARSDTGATLGTGILDKTGTASIPFNAPAGAYFLVANWAGDANYTNGGRKTEQEIITESTAGTKAVNISLNLGTNSFPLGQRTEYSVTVTPATQGSTAVPIGYVTLYSNYGQISGQLALSGGRASGIVEWDTVGSQSVYAVYNGDGNYAGANSTPITVHVAQGVPTVRLQAEATRVQAGAQISVTASLISSLASTNVAAPTGTIQFFDAEDGQARPISVPQAVVGGNGGTLIATLAATLPKGTNLITAVYSGDANWKSVISVPVTVIVNGH
ncbi:Ig-like domain repeat protein [Alloacidobacterium dinghuense]|uniref:Ig-like domain repeat protein n=1 Tax=Alloacidobacterium dinghuense TaxID=2763107 RepID=A0A7G8BGR0_9BACT|nr:Ig-like domain repeat protein [Alloacidobacterium dinghuense]QNI31730.1 Ig-like domain repeat protein [Alloacidobacterium dinghuense]